MISSDNAAMTTLIVMLQDGFQLSTRYANVDAKPLSATKCALCVVLR